MKVNPSQSGGKSWFATRIINRPQFLQEEQLGMTQFCSCASHSCPCFPPSLVEHSHQHHRFLDFWVNKSTANKFWGSQTKPGRGKSKITHPNSGCLFTGLRYSCPNVPNKWWRTRCNPRAGRDMKHRNTDSTEKIKLNTKSGVFFPEMPFSIPRAWGGAALLGGFSHMWAPSTIKTTPKSC